MPLRRLGVSTTTTGTLRVCRLCLLKCLLTLNAVELVAWAVVAPREVVVVIVVLTGALAVAGLGTVVAVAVDTVVAVAVDTVVALVKDTLVKTEDTIQTGMQDITLAVLVTNGPVVKT